LRAHFFMALNRRELFQRLIGRLQPPESPAEASPADQRRAAVAATVLERYEAVVARHASDLAWGAPASDLPASRDELREELLRAAAPDTASAARRAQLRTAYASLGWFCSEEELAVMRAGKGAFDAQDWSDAGQRAITPAFQIRKRLLDDVGALTREFDAGLRHTQTRLRQAVVGDAAAVAQLWILARQVRLPGVPFEERTGAIDFETDRWTRLLEDPGAIVWVAALGEEMLAACRVVAGEPSREAEIESLFVLPREWGNGYGRALVELALGDSILTGRDVVTWAPEKNDAAARFLTMLGFVREGESRYDPSFPGSNVQHVRFARRSTAKAAVEPVVDPARDPVV
jgi:GNAT superfamily N-acetyltransferase